VQVITAARPEWIFPFTGLHPAQFRALVRLVAERGGYAVAGPAVPPVGSSPTPQPFARHAYGYRCALMPRSGRQAE
jgi:hypothetical protein